MMITYVTGPCQKSYGKKSLDLVGFDTKAEVYLEFVKFLSAKSVLSKLKRFTSRRRK